ncbi:MAG: HaeIII family restriction endonuclease [Cyanobacteriota bacterium]
MTNLSNLHGRLLEYLIVEDIMRINACAKLTDQAIQDQQRDYLKLETVDKRLLQKFRLAVKALSQSWLEPNFSISARKELKIDRLPDRNDNSDVTDIRLFSGEENINLSIKHNHIALRHQRPRTTPTHCGYAQEDNNNEVIYFSKSYNKIVNSFIQRTQGFEFFRDLPASCIHEFLYNPVCNLVCEFINMHSKECAENLFQYLVGATNYYKVIIRTRSNEIEIQEFDKMELPKDVQASVRRQYVDLDFTNGWKITMRLHTASSRIGSSPSLKFDTVASSVSVPIVVISYD